MIDANSIPSDIWTHLETHNGALDDAVHDRKGNEGTVINNAGFIEQVIYLVADNYYNWNQIRDILNIPRITEPVKDNPEITIVLEDGDVYDVINVECPPGIKVVVKEFESGEVLYDTKTD